MAEYIEREAAVKAAKHAYNQWNLAMAAADGAREINLVYKHQELCKAVESVFTDAPAADVAPVVHGKWVVGGVHGNGVIGNWKCDICKGVSLKETLYCPNCGAKMDLEDK